MIRPTPCWSPSMAPPANSQRTAVVSHTSAVAARATASRRAAGWMTVDVEMVVTPLVLLRRSRGPAGGRGRPAGSPSAGPGSRTPPAPRTAAGAAPRAGGGRTARRAGRSPPGPPSRAASSARGARARRPPGRAPCRAPRTPSRPARDRRAPAAARRRSARSRAASWPAGRARSASCSCRTPPPRGGSGSGTRPAPPPGGRGRRGCRPRRARTAPPGRSRRGVPAPPSSRPGRVGIDDLGVLDDLVVGTLGVAGRLTGLPLRAGLLVDDLGELEGGLAEGLRARPDVVGVAALERGADVGDRRLDAGAGVGVDLVAVLREALLHLVHGRLGLVPRHRQVLRPAVVVGVGLGVLHHALDLVLVQARAALDPDLLLVVRAAILRGHLQDAVRVDVEGDLDLRHAAG